jgi:ribosome recycling factor
MASIPTETTVTNNDANMNRTVMLHRKAAKRTLPFDLAADELHLEPSSSPPPQAEDIPAARKKPCIEEPLPGATRDEATRKTASPDVSVGLPPPAADNDHADGDPVTDTQPNAGANRRWTAEEDTELSSAVANISEKWGEKRKTDWTAVAALVMGRTNRQCRVRWRDVLDPGIDRANGRTGRWTAVEDSKLKDAVQTYGDKSWGAITALVPGRTKLQCRNRWHNGLNPSIHRANESTGKWTEDEDSKLKDAVQTHGGKNWVAIAALIPGRLRKQCWNRWYYGLNPSIDRANERTGKWTEDEDSKLQDAVQTHGDKDWVAISALVPGRMKAQCRHRWHDVLDPNIGRESRRKGKWTEDEDNKLKDAVQTQGDKGWVAISALVLGRTRLQCYNRWKDVSDPSIDRAGGRKGRWTAVEDSKLKDVVQMHGGNDWVAVAALIPGRTRKQCWERWKYLYPTRRTVQYLYPKRRTVQGKEHGTLKNSPPLEQDPPSP